MHELKNETEIHDIYMVTILAQDENQGLESHENEMVKDENPGTEFHECHSGIIPEMSCQVFH